jgi:hypothetical protein
VDGRGGGVRSGFARAERAERCPQGVDRVGGGGLPGERGGELRVKGPLGPLDSVLGGDLIAGG